MPGMTGAASARELFKGRHFDREIVTWEHKELWYAQGAVAGWVAGRKDRYRARKASSRVPPEDMNPYGQERLDGVAVPTHRLVFIPAFRRDLVDGRFGEGRRSRQARPVTGSVLGQRIAVGVQITEQLARSVG
jgi:hypothetical protein